MTATGCRVSAARFIKPDASRQPQKRKTPVLRGRPWPATENRGVIYVRTENIKVQVVSGYLL